MDAGTALLWRMPVRRLEAEALRDAVLAVSGTLNRQAFGPPVPVTADANSQPVVGTGTFSAGRQECRRSVYVQQRRSLPAYVLKVFDAPVPDPTCEARSSSTVAPQSLVLMNSRYVLDQARAFADRVKAEAGDDPAKRAAAAWRLAYGTDPTAAELGELPAYLAAQAKLLAARPPAPPPAPPTPPKPNSGAAPLPPPPPADPATLALASMCQVLLESNRFLYVD